MQDWSAPSGFSRSGIPRCDSPGSELGSHPIHASPTTQVAPAIAGLAESALLILGRATDGSDMQVAEEETFAEVARAATNPLARSISAQSADARHLHGSLSLVRSPSRLSRVSGPGSPGPTTSAGCPVLQLAARDVVLALLSAGEPAALSALGDGIAAVMIHAVLFPRVPPGGKQEAAAKERAWPDERAAESLAAVLLQPTTQDWLGTAGRRAVLAALARHAAAVPTCVPTGPVHPAGCVVLGMLFARDGFWRSEEGPETHEIHSAAGPPLDLLHLCAMSHIPALRPLALDACKALSEGVSGDAGAQAETSAAPQPSPRRISGPSVGLQRASAAASRLAMRVASLRGDSPSGGYVHRLQVLLWHQTLASLVGEGPFPDSIEGGSVNGSSAPGSTLLPSAILLGGEWAAPADIVAAAHAREVSEALGRVLGRLPQPQRVLDDVRSCLVPGMVVVPLQSDPAGLGSSPVALSQQVHLAESYAQLILTGSANALDKGEAKAKRGSGR